MKKRIRLINDDEGTPVNGSDDEFKEEDMSDDEEKKKRRRRNKNVQKAPTIIDDTWVPSSMKKMRACIYCKLVLNQEKWGKLR